MKVRAEKEALLLRLQEIQQKERSLYAKEELDSGKSLYINFTEKKFLKYYRFH